MSEGYKLAQLIGRGRFGDVWRAEAPGGVQVAIKIGSWALDKPESKRVWRGLQLIRDIRHPFLLPIHAYWIDKDRVIVVMELAEASLFDLGTQLREERKQFSAQQLARYTSQVAEVLDYLHGNLIAHCGVNPANILVRSGHAKLAGFGNIHSMDGADQYHAPIDERAHAYLAPEMLRGQLTIQSDQYGLALTYAALRVNSLAPNQGSQVPDLSPLAETEQVVIRKALGPDANQRFASCVEFARRLKAAVGSSEGQ